MIVNDAAAGQQQLLAQARRAATRSVSSNVWCPCPRAWRPTGGRAGSLVLPLAVTPLASSLWLAAAGAGGEGGLGPAGAPAMTADRSSRAAASTMAGSGSDTAMPVAARRGQVAAAGGLRIGSGGAPAGNRPARSGWECKLCRVVQGGGRTEATDEATRRRDQ
jgi:hypothetical protein